MEEKTNEEDSSCRHGDRDDGDVRRSPQTVPFRHRAQGDEQSVLRRRARRLPEARQGARQRRVHLQGAGRARAGDAGADHPGLRHPEGGRPCDLGRRRRGDDQVDRGGDRGRHPRHHLRRRCAGLQAHRLYRHQQQGVRPRARQAVAAAPARWRQIRDDLRRPGRQESCRTRRWRPRSAQGLEVGRGRGLADLLQRRPRARRSSR